MNIADKKKKSWSVLSPIIAVTSLIIMTALVSVTPFQQQGQQLQQILAQEQQPQSQQQERQQDPSSVLKLIYVYLS